MSVRSLLKVVVPSLVLATVGLVWTAPAAAEGDAARGKVLGYTCLGCHGIETYKNVYPTYSVPKLRGQHPEYIVAALKGYQKGERSHATMHAHAASLSDQDIEDIAAYLGGEVVKSAGAEPVGTVPAAVATCQACHGRDGVGVAPIYPTISGQHSDYLEHALQSYKSGGRKVELMRQYASQLTDAEIHQVAEYFSRQATSLKTVPLRERLGDGR